MNNRTWVLWTGLAALLTLTSWLATVNLRYGVEDHAWANAHMALMARSFANQGILALHGVPVQNNPPLGSQPDVYIHWPPLFSMVMSLAFRAFGESEATARSMVMVVNLFYLWTFWTLVKYGFGRDVAVASIFGLLVLPVFIEYGPLIWTPNVGMAAIMLALYCFLRAAESSTDWRWIAAGAVSIVLGTWMSWEPVLLGFVLVGLSLWQGSWPRLQAAALLAAAGAVAAMAILAIFVAASTEMRADLWATVRYRMGGNYGIAPVPLHAIADSKLYSEQ